MNVKRSCRNTSTTKLLNVPKIENEKGRGGLWISAELKVAKT